MQTPGAENPPRERDGLFEIVSCERRDARPHPEERARRRRSANFERPCARLEGRGRASACALMLRDASQRNDAGKEACSCALRCSSAWGARRHGAFWRNEANGEHACLIPRETDLRLQETIAGSGPLFSDCYLQRMVQLERV